MMTSIKPPGTTNADLYDLANFTGYRLLQVSYPTPGILTWHHLAAKNCVHSNPTGSQLDLKMPCRWLQRFLTSSQPYRTCVVPHALFRCSFSSLTVETDSRRRAESSRTSPIRLRISILQVCGSFSNPAALGQAYPKDNFEKQCESHSSAQHQLSPVPAISEAQCAWTRQGATIVRINSTKRPL